MTRKEFLQRAGQGAFVALVVGACGCAKENLGGNNEPIDFTLDLSLSENSDLASNGGYRVIDNKVVVAKSMDGDYIAATRTCSHEPRKAIIFRDNEWFCTEHDARFDVDGNGLNSKGSNGLHTYNVELNGNLLRVFS